jgi:hypothetical protein
VEIGVADAAEKDLDLNVVLDGIAPCDGGGSKRRCCAGNGVSLCLVHEVTSNFQEDGEQRARRSDYKRVLFGRYPDPANLLPISVDACIFVHSIMNSALTWS